MKFSHICPTPHLTDFATKKEFHLTLAHLVEQDQQYRDFYVDQKRRNPSIYNIMDNSGFEMFSREQGYYRSDQIIALAKAVGADCAVLTDYPGESSAKTIAEAKLSAEKFKSAGLDTFFVPQSKIGDVEDLLDSFCWALRSPLIDYIGVSILAVPNAYNCYTRNPLNRYLSRFAFLQALEQRVQYGLGKTINQLKATYNKRLHMLGMTDGPNEISLIKMLDVEIDTWDSSAAIWAGLNDVGFDQSPTGLIDGKVKSHVDFTMYNPHEASKVIARNNIAFIDNLVSEYNCR